MVQANELLQRREGHEYLLKFLLVGDSDVGKNEITDSLETFPASTPSTSFVSPNVSKITSILLEGRRVRIQLWDTSGQGRFATIFRSFSRGAQGVLLVYDITNRWSFEGIRRWLAEIDEYAPGIPKILIGNRLHLEFNRAVSRIEAEAFARKKKMQYFEVSPLAYFNVLESLTELARVVISRNGLRQLWKFREVPLLQDLCCRAIIQLVENIHAIERLPIPSFLKTKIRSFAQGAHVCTAALLPRNLGQESKNRRIIRFLGSSVSRNLFRSRSNNCSLM
uniref:SOCS box domain-containing protein n=1 Tax=Syphacia muris TaxID=451379 RepID=A0A0N5AIM9_9BILA